MMRSLIPFALALPTLFLTVGCQDAADNTGLPQVDNNERVAVTSERITNLEAPVPPQCYTRTEEQHNPCYTCHQMYDRRNDSRMNQLDDGGLQGDYLFSELGQSNHWQNLFIDRQAWLERISDDTIVAYINQDNYSALPANLRERGWSGFIPDLKNYHLADAAFDDQGFARDGSGWVAFNYKPFPGTFWPTNGSTDDVLIRLPAPFRQLDGRHNRDIYLLNLTLLEMAIKQKEILSIPAMDERQLDLDLDNDGALSPAVTTLRKRSHYVGDAARVTLAHQQYPQGTEFMHSVRYVGVSDDNRIVVPPRMKELRYMRKIRELAPHDVKSRYARERKDKLLGRLPDFVSHGDKGMENGLGWMVRGFIEDYDGTLRPQSYEENLHCMGCHAAVGVTIDQTFAFGRKVDGRAGWGYIDTRGMPDAPNLNDDDGEILNYLKRAGGGSEFRENPEMRERWFDRNGEVRTTAVRQADVYTLISPSRERALKLNKAYTHIVRHQSYIHGRDATWLPAGNVLKQVDESQPPLPREHRYFGWDLRLDWQAAAP